MHKSLDEVGALSQGEIALWRWHLVKEPPWEDRAGFYLSQIASILINVNRGKSSRAVKASELDPWFDPWNSTVPTVEDEVKWLTSAFKQQAPEQ